MLRALFLALLFAFEPAQAQDAAALRARDAELKEHLTKNAFGRPLHVDSAVSGGTHKGRIYAVIEHPYSAVAAALARPAQWCEILMLQVNIKRCDASTEAGMTAFITRKPRDPVDDAQRVDFRFERATASAEYLQAVVSAPSGPLGTRDYETRVEAAPLDSRRTLMHMSYTYSLGSMARFALDAYLAGAGRDKAGFSVAGGERGVVERAAMRHYLAIEAYLNSLATPREKRLEARLRDWYAATTRYPQLREPVGIDEYVEMKLNEFRTASRLVDALG
jgi:hypothetical protein